MSMAHLEHIKANLPKRGGKTRALTKEDFSQRSAIFRHINSKTTDYRF